MEVGDFAATGEEAQSMSVAGRFRDYSGNLGKSTLEFLTGGHTLLTA